MKDKLKGLLNFFLRFGISGALLWYLYTKIDVAQTAELIKSADMGYLTYALLTFLFIHVILLVRWVVFIRALDLTTVTLFNVTRYFFIGLFGNLFLPSSIGGDIIKVLGLCRETSQKAKVVASVMLDRLSGFASIAIVAVCAFTFGYSLIEEKSLVIFIIMMAGGLFMIGGILFNERIFEFGCRIFNRFPKIKNSLMALHYDAALLKGKKMEAFKGVGLACASQVIFAFSYYLAAKALHQDISVVYFLIFVPMICIAASFPSIGGLGVREMGAVYLFGKIGVESGIAVSLGLINFLLMIVMGLIGGAFYVATLSSGRIQHIAPDAPRG